MDLAAKTVVFKVCLRISFVRLRIFRVRNQSLEHLKRVSLHFVHSTCDIMDGGAQHGHYGNTRFWMEISQSAYSLSIEQRYEDFIVGAAGMGSLKGSNVLTFIRVAPMRFPANGNLI